MHSLRITNGLKKLGKYTTLLAFIAITYLAIRPSNIVLVDQANDKLKHMLAFASLAAGLCLFWEWPWRKVGGLLLLYGIGIEVVQYFIPRRYASVWDVVADCVGIGFGSLAAIGLQKLCIGRRTDV